MIAQPAGAVDPERELDEVLACYLDAVAAGELQDREAWLKQYPEFAEELRCFFTQAAQFDQLTRPLREIVAAGDPLATARTFADYELVELIAHGGMGVVYKAMHPRLGRQVALKVLPGSRTDDDQAISRFRREMKAVGAVDHPNIVRAMHASETDGIPYLVMDYVRGLDLAELVRRCGPVPIADACELIRQAAVGLHYAHERGLVHRDIKPSNLFLSDDGVVKVLDLGLARFQLEQAAEPEPPAETVAGAGDDPALTATGQTLGTADYVAPEQVSDVRHVDIRADVYGLGCTLYMLLAGRAPFAGPGYKTVAQKTAAHVREPVPPLGQFRPDVPQPLVDLLGRMLAKCPEDRCGTAREVAAALEPFASDGHLESLLRKAGREPSSIREAGSGSERATLSHGRRTFRKRPLVRMIGRLALAGCIVAGAVMIWMLRDPGDSAGLGPPTALLGNGPPSCEYGWRRWRCDLGGTSFYPFPSRQRTSNRLETVDWKPERVFGSISSVVTGDVTGDGSVEVVLRDDDTLAVFDRRGQELWRASLRIDSWVEVPPDRVLNPAAPELADIDGDGALEVVLATGSRRRKGWHDKAPQRLIIYDGDGRILRNMPVLDGAYGRPQKCFDFNGDGRVDIVVATGAYRHPHAICVYDWKTGAQLFRADFADATDVAGVGDVDGDGRQEMLAIQGFDCHVDTPVGDYDAHHCYAAVFDTHSKRRWYRTYEHSLAGCLADLDGDNTPEVVLLNELPVIDGVPVRGTLEFLDHATGAPLRSYQGGRYSGFKAFSVADVTGDGCREFVVGDGAKLHVVDARAQLVASKPAPRTFVLATNDLNGDGRVEIVLRQGTNLIVLNGQLDELARYEATGTVRSAIITDIDGDGVNEVLLLAGEIENRVLQIVHFSPAGPPNRGEDSE